MSNEDAQQLQGSALGRGSFSPRSCERYLLKSPCEQRYPGAAVSPESWGPGSAGHRLHCSLVSFASWLSPQAQGE